MKSITDPELLTAFQKREMLVERKLNILRIYVVLFLSVLDVVISRLSGYLNIHLSFLFAALGLVFAVYFALIQHISSGKHYYPWLKYITVTVDYLFTFGLFMEYNSTSFFNNMPREVVVFHFITIIIFINILSVTRYSRTVILYSTLMGVAFGTYLLVRYVPTSWSTWFTTVLILLSGLITYLFSTDLNTLFLKLRKRERLNRFLSRKIIECIDNGVIDIKLGGEKKEVTVLLADIRNFSSLSEFSDAFEIVSILNNYFTEMTRIIFKYEGMIDKYIGDAIMAIFGTPVSRPDDALRAVQASIEMQQCVSNLNLKRTVADKPPIHIGIAIHTGIVVAGNIGSLERMDYTVIGAPVNLVSRIEEMNKFYKTQILISETTYRKVRRNIDMQYVSNTQLRGHSKEIQLYTIPTVFYQPQQESSTVIESKLASDEYVDIEYLLKGELSEIFNDEKSD